MSEKVTVILVEDDEAIRKLLNHALTAAGYLVTSAERADEALVLIEAMEFTPAFTPAVLLTDVLLPGMNGHRLAKEIVRLCPTIRIGFITGWFDEDSVKLGMCSECSYLLGKPFTMSELIDFIERIATQPTCEALFN